jgi:AraC-like DNA-binding protein
VSEKNKWLPAYCAKSEIIRGVDLVVSQLGHDPEQLYESAGLDALLFQKGGTMVPYPALVHLLDFGAKTLAIDDFGVRIGSVKSSFPVGLLSPFLIHSVDVRSAITSICENIRLINEGVEWKLSIDSGVASLTRIEKCKSEGGIHMLAASMVKCLKLLRYLCGDQHKNFNVSLPFQNERKLAIYQEAFGNSVRLGVQHAKIEFPVEYLDIPISTGSKENYDLIKSWVFSGESIKDPDFCYIVKALIRHEIAKGDCDRESAARFLSMHPKKMQRELVRYGTSFRQLRAEVKLDLAESLLRNSDVSLVSISESLGFSEPCVFTRWFKGVYNKTPSDWRAECG